MDHVSVTSILIKMGKGYHFVENTFQSTLAYGGWLSNSHLEAINYPEIQHVRRGLCNAMLSRGFMQLVETRYSLMCSHTSHNSIRKVYRLTEFGISTLLNLHTPEWFFYPFDFQEIPNFYRAGYHLRGFSGIPISDEAKRHIEMGNPFVFKHKKHLWRFENGKLDRRLV